MHATQAKWQAELVEQAFRIAGATELSHELAGLELRDKVDKKRDEDDPYAILIRKKMPAGVEVLEWDGKSCVKIDLMKPWTLLRRYIDKMPLAASCDHKEWLAAHPSGEAPIGTPPFLSRRPLQTGPRSGRPSCTATTKSGTSWCLGRGWTRSPPFMHEGLDVLDPGHPHGRRVVRAGGRFHAHDEALSGI